MDDSDEVYLLLTQAYLTTEVELIDEPHIVVCRDTETGITMYSGPFRTGLEAMARAQRDQDSERAAGSSVLEFTIAPLFAD